jgi:hypothetical protein
LSGEIEVYPILRRLTGMVGTKVEVDLTTLLPAGSTLGQERP